MKPRLLAETGDVGTVETKKEKEKLTQMERWKLFKQNQKETESGSLFRIYERLNGNNQQILKLLEPPALFSSIPEFPDVDPNQLIETPQPGNLPIKPLSKGECILLLNSPYA